MKRVFTTAAGRHFAEIFEPDTILPGQYAVVRGLPSQGERALLLAVLEMALRDLELFSGKKAWLLRFPTHEDGKPYSVLGGARARYAKARRERDALLAWFRSNSTTVSLPQISRWICSRPRISPECSSRYWRSLSCCGVNLMSTPARRSSPARVSSSKLPKRTTPAPVSIGDTFQYKRRRAPFLS